MTPDWNWFFSTLSQSTAAIVGIIGAFIIAKIFANQATFTEKKNRLKTLVVEAEKILDKIGTIDFDWYNREKNSAGYGTAARRIHSIEHEDPSLLSEAELLSIFDESNFSIFSEKEPILEKLREEVIHVCKENEARRLRKEAAERARANLESGRMSGFEKIGALLQNIPDFSAIASPKTHLDVPGLSVPWAALSTERELITECHLEARHHARIVGNFIESVKGNPESPPQITWSLILVSIIFMAGVIYPLTFMPAVSPPEFSLAGLCTAFLSVKGALLTLLAGAFIFVFWMFTRTNIGMKYPQDQINKLERLSHTNDYCEYFKFLSVDK